ncbi:hypothetical protein AJ88_03820 [Mesorhizobium amorphae CCBAU 01583]|nr:hypothetical protein AJ88_03820 [Mesorhizobium amorphae CCBAU 01583]
MSLTNEATIAKPSEHEVRWGGPNGGWRVIRTKDKTVRPKCWIRRKPALPGSRKTSRRPSP